MSHHNYFGENCFINKLIDQLVLNIRLIKNSSLQTSMHTTTLCLKNLIPVKT